MARTRHTPGVRTYYDTIQRIFNLESEILSATLPHPGERGRNDEERFREFLKRVLPRRYSVGTGFIVCSEPNVTPSSQTDVVIFDEIYNSPLHRELAAFVYPVEMVYGVVEVKGLLRSSDLKKVMWDIGELRQLAPYKRYVQYGAMPVAGDESGNFVTAKAEFAVDLSPRTFVFAYDACDWNSIESFASSWKKALEASGKAHIHGVTVLSKNWFVCQVPFTGHTAELRQFSDNALLRFITKLLDSIASVQMFPMSVDRYLGLEPKPFNP